MSNPMKYIKDLEAAGFQRAQAEAQVQMVLDVLEGDLVTINEFKSETNALRSEIGSLRSEMTHQFRELELRMVIKLGVITVSAVSVWGAVLSWLIKVH